MLASVSASESGSETDAIGMGGLNWVLFCGVEGFVLEMEVGYTFILCHWESFFFFTACSVGAYG